MAVVCFVACWLAAGCSGSTAGRAVPSDSQSQPAPTSAVASGPRSFNLSGVDPCALIPPARRLEFGLNQPQDNSPTDGQPSCVLPSSVGLFAGVFLDFRQSAQATVSPVRMYIFETVVIQGFRIPLVARPGLSSCEGFIQTGLSQYLSVSANGLGKTPDRVLCSRVQPLLKIAIATLEKLQPS